jgi:hypothetical protein
MLREGDSVELIRNLQPDSIVALAAGRPLRRDRR